MNTAITKQFRRTALHANFTGISTRQRNARIRRLMAAIAAPNTEADYAKVWA